MQPGPLGTVDPGKNAVFAEWEMRGLHNVLQGARREGVSLPFHEAISADFSLPNKRSTNLSQRTPSHSKPQLRNWQGMPYVPTV